jgi:hypothetical protein
MVPCIPKLADSLDGRQPANLHSALAPASRQTTPLSGVGIILQACVIPNAGHVHRQDRVKEEVGKALVLQALGWISRILFVH